MKKTVNTHPDHHFFLIETEAGYDQNRKQILYSSIWFQIIYYPYHKHEDGSETYQHIVLAGHPFGIYIKLVDLEKVRIACENILRCLPLQRDPFPPAHRPKPPAPDPTRPEAIDPAPRRDPVELIEKGEE